MRVVENVAVNSAEVLRVADALKVVRQLVEGEMRSIGGDHVPPGSGTNGGSADVGCEEGERKRESECRIREHLSSHLLPTAM